MNKLSIIITYFNNEDYISECIHSLKSQKIKDFDIIVVDDGSTDRSAEILQALKSYDKDVHFIQLQENTGHAHAKCSFGTSTWSIPRCR